MTKIAKLTHQNYAKFHNKKQKLVKFAQFPLIQDIKTTPISVFTTFQEIFIGVFTAFQEIFGEKRWFLMWVVGLNSCGAVYGIFGGGVGRWRLCRSRSRSLCPTFGFSTHAVPTAPLPAAPISI